MRRQIERDAIADKRRIAKLLKRAGIFKPKRRINKQYLRTSTTLRKLRKEFSAFLQGSAKLAKVGRKRTRRYTQQGLAARRGKVQVPIQPGQRVSVTKSGEIRVTGSDGSAPPKPTQNTRYAKAEELLTRRFNVEERGNKGLTTDLARAIDDLRHVIDQHPTTFDQIVTTSENAATALRATHWRRPDWEGVDWPEDDDMFFDFPELFYYHDDA